MKVVFTYDYGKEKMDQVVELGYDVVIVPEKDIENGELIDDAEILICYDPFKRIDINKMPKLKWIQVSSIGIDQVPIDICLEREITVTNNNGGYSKPTAEWIVMNILETLKNIQLFNKKKLMKDSKLEIDVLEVCEKRIGFLGTGTIPREAAIRLQGFEAPLIGFNSDGRMIPDFDECYKLSELDRYISNLDVLVVCLPHTPKTHHVLDERLLSLMKDDSVLINVSRGAIIDQAVLEKLLANGKFRAVALDVFEKEPLPDDSILWELDRVYLSPHNSWMSEKRNERRFALILKNLKRNMKGKELANIADLERGY